MSIKLNTLIKWLVPEGINTDERVERVLWIDSKTTQVIVIQMTDERVLPFLRTYEEIASALATGNAHIQTSDSYIANIRADEQLSTKARERRDRNWELSRPIVDGGVDLMISPKRRGPIITKHAEICGRQKSEIYDLLRCFWWSGGIKNSLATDFHRCGGKGKKREIVSPDGDHSPKRGRPRKYTSAPGEKGVNVTASMKKKFERGIKRFYETPEKRSLTNAYSLTLSTGQKFDNPSQGNTFSFA